MGNSWAIDFLYVSFLEDFGYLSTLQKVFFTPEDYLLHVLLNEFSSIIIGSSAICQVNSSISKHNQPYLF